MGLSGPEQGPLAGCEDGPQGCPTGSPRPPWSQNSRREPRKQEDVVLLGTVSMLGHPNLREVNKKAKKKKSA